MNRESELRAQQSIIELENYILINHPLQLVKIQAEASAFGLSDYEYLQHLKDLILHEVIL